MTNSPKFHAVAMLLCAQGLLVLLCRRPSIHMHMHMRTSMQVYGGVAASLVEVMGPKEVRRQERLRHCSVQCFQATTSVY